MTQTMKIKTRLPLMKKIIELGEMWLELFRLINNTQERGKSQSGCHLDSN
ncbi:unnamed protein product [Lathyrus oleraceus]